MPGAQTTLKVTPEEHQTLLALLRFLAGEVPQDQFRAVLQSQGRKLPNDIPIERIVEVIADQLIGPFS